MSFAIPGGRLLGLVLVVSGVTRLAAAQHLESCQFTTGGGTYDLCPLVGREFKICKPGVFEGVEACYMAGLMGNIESPCPGVAGPALETLDTSLGKGCRILGTLADRSVAPLQGKDGVELKYTGGDVCGNKGEKWSSSLQFVCNRSIAVRAAQGASLLSVETSPADRCTYDFVIASEHGCPIGLALSPSAVLLEGERMLGHPSKVLFAVLAIAAAYLGVGVYYKSTVLGRTTFPDFIPHIGFWKSYPSLVRDGVLYTVESLSGGSSLGSRESSSEREQLHSNRQYAQRDTFSNLVPHRIGGAATADDNLL